MPHPLRALPVLALLALPLAAAAQGAAPPQPVPARVIAVTGEGRSDRKPDMAVVSLGVTQQAPTAGEAMAGMAEGMTAVLATLTEAGIAPADVQTGELRLDPVYGDYTSSALPPQDSRRICSGECGCITRAMRMWWCKRAAAQSCVMSSGVAERTSCGAVTLPLCPHHASCPMSHGSCLHHAS